MDIPQSRIWLSLALLLTLFFLLFFTKASFITSTGISLLFFAFSISSWPVIKDWIRPLRPEVLSFGAGLILGISLIIYWTYTLNLFFLIPKFDKFRHFSSLQPPEFTVIASMPILGLGLWLFIQHWTAPLARIKLLPWFLGLAGPTTIAYFLFPPYLVLSSVLVASLAFGLYNSGNRLSLTYLILWVLLIAVTPSSLLAQKFDWPINTTLPFAAAQFLLGICYALFFRQILTLMGYSLKQLQIPLGGPNSFKLRIQLAFIFLALSFFILIGLFSYLFLRQRVNQQESFNIVEQLLAVYALLLPLASVAGIGLANHITRQISNIGEKLANTNLKSNEPLEWSGDDELGRLVNNYNRMIEDLEQSAQQLAASERESAWREMAQQVAHEIKNPLTPMRLHIQQLVRLQKEDPEKAKTWIERTAKTLIEQIDVLSRIATEFSHFAKLPIGSYRFHLAQEILHDTAELFTQNEANAKIDLILAQEELWIKVDRDQLQRVFTNLVRNAVQAIPEDRDGKINIKLIRQHEEALIEVQDNGRGISLEDQAHIFQPKFTTKTTGSGLGLAMAKSSIEQMGGEIWFETKLHQGTTFYISLKTVEKLNQDR